VIRYAREANHGNIHAKGGLSLCVPLLGNSARHRYFLGGRPFIRKTFCRRETPVH